MWVEQCDSEWSEERIFWRRGFHSLQERSTTAPSQGQFMPMTRNITVYLAIIHVKHM